MIDVLNTINSPLVGAGAAVLGLSAALKEVREWVSKGLAWLKSAKGQAAITDAEAAAPVVLQALKDAGHPVNASTQSIVQGALSQLLAASKVLILGLLLLGAATVARAGILDLSIPISPTAGASSLDNTVLLLPSVLKINAGRFWFDVNGYAGPASILEWGPNYGVGLTAGILAQGIASDVGGTLAVTGFTGELAGGVVADWLGVDAALIWAGDGARLGLTKPF